MLNLIDNAIKYRKSDVPLVIHIDAQKQPDGWRFSIKDNGIGIDEAHLGAVFEPFKRLHPHLYSDGEGIGLTSCRKMVRMLGGEMDIASKAGVGTTVSFLLP
jgi:two-component system, LuxR family, sensor kinase FixL